MALSLIIGEDGHTPESLRAQAKVQLRNLDGVPTIARIDLEVEGSVPGIDEDAFRAYAEQAKAGCVVSRALAGVPEIELKATLV
jgi:osmotically inducible protein OsmC